MDRYIVAIDGPAGVGKSSVSLTVALNFGFTLIDTGAMYRSVAMKSIENSVTNSKKLEDIAKNLDFKFKTTKNLNYIYVDGKDITNLIRTEEVSKKASDVAKIKGVRSILVDKQREISKNQSVVMEGRDIGTVVFPNANIKIFLTADPKIRAERRLKELLEKGVDIDFETVYNDILKRDHNDSTRVESPLKKADDAVEVDTSYLTLDQVSQKVIDIISKKLEK